jgi:signal transduction histidine kinase
VAIGSSQSADGRGRRRLSAAFTFDRQLALALLVVAIAPLALFGVVAYGRFTLAVREEGERGVSDAARSVTALVEQVASRLSTTAQSYATWGTLVGYVDALDTEQLRTNVAEFLVGRGTADVVSIVAGDDVTVAGGSTQDAAALAAIARRALAGDAGTHEVGPRLVALPSGVHVVRVWPIDLAGRSGPGSAAAGAGGAGIALARRLDGEFALDAAGLTGFEVGVYGLDGTLEAASDAAMAAEAGTPDPAALATGQTTVRDSGGVASGTVALRDVTGAPVGALVVATSLDALNAIDAELLPILSLTLALTVAGAALLAILIARSLRRRLVAVEGGMAAVAGGDTSVRLAARGGDDLDRLAESHNRLAATLGRRDRALRESVGAMEQLTPDRAVDDLAEAGMRAAVSVFGLDSARVIDGAGRGVAEHRRMQPAGGSSPGASVDGSSPGAPVDGPAAPHPMLIRTPMSVPPDRWVIEATPAPGSDWTDGDSALFALFARQLGTAIRDAQLYAEAAARAAELERVNRLQGDFLRGVSHNLQTPLTHITVLAEDLRDRSPDEPDVSQRAEVIRVEGERLAHLVAQLLTLSRLEADVLTVQADPVALAPTVWRAWDGLGSDRTLRVEDGAAGVLAIGDRAAVEQVLWMLLDNAIRYAPDGPITVRIRRADRAGLVSPGAAEAAVEIAVDDEGPGIPLDEREAIFGRFARGSTGAERSGTGLGLDVARGLVRAMGGTIRCEDAPDSGARFAFVLPAEEAGSPA